MKPGIAKTINKKKFACLKDFHNFIYFLSISYVYDTFSRMKKRGIPCFFIALWGLGIFDCQF